MWTEGMAVNIRVGSPEAERDMARVIPVSGMPWDWEFQTVTLPSPLEGTRVLNVGAGVSDSVAKLLEGGVDAYAVDPAYRNLRELRKRAEAYLRKWQTTPELSEYYEDRVESTRRFWASIAENPDRYKSSFATQLPFEDDYFDLVYSTSAIFPHISLDWKTLVGSVDECIRVTRPGGSIQLSPYEGYRSPANEILNHLEQIQFPNEQRLALALRKNPLVTATIETIPVGNWENHRRLVLSKR